MQVMRRYSHPVPEKGCAGLGLCESVEQVAAGHVFRDQQDGVVLDADAQKPDDILGMGLPQDRHLRKKMNK